MRSQASSEKRICLSDGSSRSVAAYHEATGVRSLVLAVSHFELIASGPPSRPRNGTTSCTVTASLTRGLRVLWMLGQSCLFDGGCQQIATTAIVPFNTGLWQHSSQAFSGLSGKSRQTVKSRHFVPTAWLERCVVDDFSSTASGEGLTNDCSDGALPHPDSPNNPELDCVFPLHNEFDFASLEGLEGLKVNNIKPQKVPSLPRWPLSDRSRFLTQKTISTSCRRSSMRKWRNCTSLHSTVLTQDQADYIGVKVEGPFQRWALPLFR